MEIKINLLEVAVQGTEANYYWRACGDERGLYLLVKILGKEESVLGKYQIGEDKTIYVINGCVVSGGVVFKNPENDEWLTLTGFNLLTNEINKP